MGHPPLPIDESDFSGPVKSVNSVQIKCIVKGEAQKSPLFQGGF